MLNIGGSSNLIVVLNHLKFQQVCAYSLVPICNWSGDKAEIFALTTLQNLMANSQHLHPYLFI